MLKILFIGIGGALGTMIRYVVSGLDYKFSNGIFPVSTLVVNATGCLIIGFLWGLFERVDVSSNLRMFIFIGILGGYTTFSTFGLENFNLFRDGEFKIALLNILTTNLLGIACVVIGFSVSKLIFNFTR